MQGARLGLQGTRRTIVAAGTAIRRGGQGDLARRLPACLLVDQHGNYIAVH